jgi:hypothetical protein
LQICPLQKRQRSAAAGVSFCASFTVAALLRLSNTVLGFLKATTMQGEHIGGLKKWAAEIAREGSSEIRWNPAIELISKHFSVQMHEVAILGVTPDERFLRFLMPDNLRPIGRIPLSSTSSLAVRTVREQRAEVINHFSVVPHASVFEAVPINDSQRSEAIQKIMSAPVVVGKKSVGATQVSRKGNSSAEAGPDFTAVQLRDLKAIADILAPCIVLSLAPTPV